MTKATTKPRGRAIDDPATLAAIARIFRQARARRLAAEQPVELGRAA